LLVQEIPEAITPILLTENYRDAEAKDKKMRFEADQEDRYGQVYALQSRRSTSQA
jgi:hypothetical protein